MLKTKKAAVAAAVAAIAFPAAAQQVRPDAGTLLQQQPQPAAVAPPPGGAPIVVPQDAPPAVGFDKSLKAMPTAFEIRGNTLIPSEDLQPALAEYVGKAADMETLVKAAAAVRRIYRDRGYLLTEAYLPEQRLPVDGGPVVIQVLEARVGQVSVQVEDESLSESLANAIVNNNLKPGDFISEKSLDRPVLLLRDLVGFDATASVTPGANPGEADITVIVKSQGAKADGLLSLDNTGVGPAGKYRATATANLNNLAGMGDVLSVRLQSSERGWSDMYRVAYNTTINGYATRLGLSVTKTDYQLGKQFAALGASGTGVIYGLTLTQPIIRARTSNLIGVLTIERKDLDDTTQIPATAANRRVDTARVSLLGNFVDELLGSSFNSYGAHYTAGKVKLDPSTLAIDQGAAGLQTAGSFSKLNFEYLRTTFLSAESRFTANFQAQVANKNLASAEKIGLGGTNGVRAYPSGESTGDTGAILQLEYTHQLPDPEWAPKLGLRGSIFYDVGWMKFNQAGAPFFVAQQSEVLRGAGVGLSAGTYGDWQLTTQVAWRIGRAANSDPDRKPRVWVSLQKWL